MSESLQATAQKIENIYNDRALLADPAAQALVAGVLADLDAGRVRVAEPLPSGEWKVNEWVKKAILLHFAVSQMEVQEVGPFHFHDKIKLKSAATMKGVRAVPGSVVREGSYLEPGVILMPSFVNIGAYVGAGTMVDTWATVGSCAQVGQRVHLSGGVGIGGVLEPPQAAPVIIEDGVFVGSRCIVVEGVHVGREAVLGANVVLTKSTKIIDVTGPEPKELKGYVPPRSVVIPGTRTRAFPAGEFGVPCALIIGTRKPSTDEKTSLNEALREFQVDV